MAVELSQGYVSLSVSTEGAQREVQKMFDGWQGLAATAGKKSGDTLSKGLADGTKAALADAQAAHERYAINVANSTKKAVAASEAQEAALRKVAIAEARLSELEATGKASKAQLLAAEDRLAAARKSASDTALKQAAADKAVTDAQDALRQSSERLNASQKELEDSTQKAGTSATTMAGKIKSTLAGLAAKVPNPFKPMEADAKESGDKAGDNFTKEFKQRTSTLGDGLKAGIAGFMGGLASGAISGLTNELKSFYDEAKESQKVGATTEQIIKQTGGTAKISAEEIGKLANSISAKTGIDDEAVQAGANLLLTFKNVRNEVGQGADIFNRATAAAQDMAAAGFGDAEGSAKMLGKALNDPIAGMSALGRAGVTFSAQQKEQIKAYVAQGDLLSAQKLMMKEVESQVGGVAEASATSGEKFTAQLNNLKEDIGTAFMPMLNEVFSVMGNVFTWVGDNVVPVLVDAGQAFSDFWAGFTIADPAEIGAPLEGVVGIGQQARQVLLPIIDRIGASVREVVGWVQRFAGSFTSADGTMAPFAQNVAGLARSFQQNLLPGLLAVGASIRDNLVPFVQHLASLFVTHVLPVINQLVVFISTQVLPVLGKVATFIGTQVIPIIATIARVIVDTVIPALAAIYTAILEKVMPPLMAFINYVMENVAPKVALVFNEIIIPLFKLLAAIVTWVVNNVVVPILGLLGDFLTNVLGPVFKWLWEKAISPAIDSIIAAIHWVRDDGVKTFTDFIDKVKETVGKGVETVGKIWDGIKAAFQGPMKFVQDIINGLIDAFNTVSKIFGGPNVAHISIVAAQEGTGRAPSGAGFATGGVLPGYSPGVDNMHFFSPQFGTLSLSGGEAIMVPEFARMLGAQGVAMLNQAARAGRSTLAGVIGSMHFADGGIVNLRGHTFTAEFARRIQLAEALVRSTFNIMQGGFMPATSYSGTSHQRDALDIGNTAASVVLALRSVGIPAWDRTGKGNWAPHVHGVPLPGAGSAGGSAIWQAQDYLAGGDGLGGKDNGPRPGTLLGNLAGVVLNLAEGAKSLVNWPATLAGALAGASGIKAPGAFGDMLRAVPQKVSNVIGEGAGHLLHLPGFASGTDSAPPGWAWVGENGAELVKFRGGEKVMPAGPSRRFSSESRMPEYITLVDSDGTFIARMRTEARESLNDTWTSGKVLARKEGASA